MNFGDARLPERFWRKVDADPSGCWLWTAATRHGGYGRFGVDYKTLEAHRVAYEALVCPIPEGLVIDHLCRVPACVNPAHLEPVTRGENVLRGEGSSADRARQTECKNGHPFDEANTYVRHGLQEGNRRCRICHADAERRRRRAA